MKAYMIKHTDLGWLDQDKHDYGPMNRAGLFTSKAGANRNIEDSDEEIVQVEIKVVEKP